MDREILTPNTEGADEPIIGAAFSGFMDNVVHPDARDSVKKSAYSVLSASLSYGASSTGLVVGRVQSGKTLSYEAVISLARDNGFPLVIVISGISNILLAQGKGRLNADLKSAENSGWQFLSPADKTLPVDYIKNELQRICANWQNRNIPIAYKQTAVIPLLKHHSRISDLTDTLRTTDLGGLPVLIVDDEADQASLNTLGAKGKKSSTYARIQELRDTLPNHYYLQYTATPQAPLLVAIEDTLSPDFVRVLEPGTEYTGGDSYFARKNDIVKEIPFSELNAEDFPSGPPPSTLLKALREFLIGVASCAAGGGKPETRSMLVHPSSGTSDHAIFYNWIKRAIDEWKDLYFHRNEVEPNSLKERFRAAWTDLASTQNNIPDFESCWNSLEISFINLDVTEVNGRNKKETPVINWSPTKAYILVGGQAIDRGFTVEGLTVTYMSRGAGTFTADTIQQRARFFGYKSSYLGLCRVYLDPEVHGAYKKYVDHEREMLKTLHSVQEGNESLKNWKRKFLMDASMRPTRASVIDIPMLTVKGGDRWIYDSVGQRQDSISIEDGSSVLADLTSDVTWTPDPSGRHFVGHIDLEKAVTLFQSITPLSVLGDKNYDALALQLERLAANHNPADTVALFQMSKGNIENRTVTDRGKIQIFSGRSGNYGGDQDVYDPDAILSVQIHKIRVKGRGKNSRSREAIVAAWRIPDKNSSDWMVEE